jgi:hypothetical protein
VGLSSTPPADDGSNITEPTDPAYARPTIANNLTTFSTATARECHIQIDVPFPAPTTTPYDVGYFFLRDPTSGRMCDSGRFAERLTVPVGTPCRIPAGVMSFLSPPSTLY